LCFFRHAALSSLRLAHVLIVRLLRRHSSALSKKKNPAYIIIFSASIYYS